MKVKVILFASLFLIAIVGSAQTREELTQQLSVLFNAGDYKKAIPVAIKASEAAKKELGEGHLDYARSILDLARVYQAVNDIRNAEIYFLQALDLCHKHFGKYSSEYAGSLQELGFFYFRTGDYANAARRFGFAADIQKSLFGETDADYLTNLGYLGNSWINMSDYEKAEPVLLKTKWLATQAGDESNYALSLNGLALLYLQTGQYAKAEPFFLEAEKLAKKTDPFDSTGYATVLDNLGVLYTEMQEYEKAEPYFLGSLAIRKKQGVASRAAYALTLNNLASLYCFQEKYTKAEPLLLQAIALEKKLFGEHPELATSMANLAALYYETKKYAKAEQLLLQAAAMRKKVLGEEHPDYAGNLTNLSTLYTATRQYDKAETFRIRGNEITRKNIRKAFTYLSEKEKEQYLQNRIGILDENNSFLYTVPQASPAFVKHSFDQLLFFKSLLLSGSKNMLATLQASKDDYIKKSLDEWMLIKKELGAAYALPVKERDKDIKKKELRAEVLEKELVNYSALFGKQNADLQKNMRDVRAALETDEAAIEFVSFELFNQEWTDSVIYAAYILRKTDSIPLFVPLCEEKQLQRLFVSAGATATSIVNSFYRGTEITNKSTAAVQGKQLYQLVWAPLEPYLKGIHKIAYSPAGKLYSVAFHALPTDSQAVLMDRYQLRQYSSTRQMEGTGTPSTTPGSITLFGNARFSMDSTELVKGKDLTASASTTLYAPPGRGNRGSRWDSLPGTAEEVKKIAGLFDANKIISQVFTQVEASEENLKALDGRAPPILHIATHGFFLDAPEEKAKKQFGTENVYSLAADPLLRSGLVLSGGNYAWSGKTPIDGIEDGIVTAYEISQLNLSNTELVVLSACETALGDVKGSEGVFGLQRAFKMAGVKKMILSLWQVPDKETAELMSAFYDHWIKGASISHAFAQAQAGMRKKYAPYYWAAFVLIE